VVAKVEPTYMEAGGNDAGPDLVISDRPDLPVHSSRHSALVAWVPVVLFIQPVMIGIRTQCQLFSPTGSDLTTRTYNYDRDLRESGEARQSLSSGDEG
jgi:hypothetical protein